MKELLFRVTVAALVSAVFCAGAVFFVVDMSMRGLETGISTASSETGKRIDDVNSSIEALKADLLRELDRIDDENKESFESIAGLLREADAGQQSLERSIAANSSDVEAASIAILGAIMVFLGTPMAGAASLSISDQAVIRSNLKREAETLCAEILDNAPPACADLRNTD